MGEGKNFGGTLFLMCH